MKTMNKKSYALALAFACSIGLGVNAQLATSNFSGSNVDGDVTGRNPRLDFAFQQVRNQKPIEKKIKIEGSAFMHEDYRRASIYSKDGIEGTLYLRYDGFRDQFEIKPISEKEETQVLLPREDIYCVINGIPAKFKGYYNKKENFKEGYLFVLADIEGMVLYEKRSKLFKEGKDARTSLELNVPNRFVEDRELYLETKKEGKSDIQFFKSSKKEVYALFENDADGLKKIKKFVSEHKINLKESEGVARVFKYYRTL